MSPEQRQRIIDKLLELTTEELVEEFHIDVHDLIQSEVVRRLEIMSDDDLLGQVL